MMEREYDTKKAEQLLAGSEEMKKKFAGGGKSFGDGMAYIENSSAYVSLFGDENGDYVVAMLQGERTDGNLCYNDSYSGGSAEVVKRGDKEACLKEMKESSSSYIMPMSVSLIYLERRVGDYSLMVVAYAKEKKGAVINEAENIIFGLDFQGQEVEWTDRMNLSVNVYETEEGSLQRIPVADADVKLYKYGYSYTDYEYGGMTTLEAVRSAKTDDNGIAEFRDLEIGSYTVEATREGYAKGTDYVYASDTNSSIRLQKLEPLMVTVTEGAYPRAPVAGAKVKLYNMTESYEYELIKTNYTDSNGTVNFGKIDMTGKVEVSKEGYKNNTATVGAYSTRNITIYLTPVGKGMLKVYADESVAGDPFPNYPPVSEAKIELYNKSGGSYMLVKTLYTNSSGIADFGYVSTEGKIEASKNGYYNSTAIIRADTITYVTTFTVRLVKVAGNASADYPLIQAGGSGCMTPSKDRAPPEWIIGLPDGKGACFWETEPVYGSFGKLINVSGFNLTVAPNEVSVNKTLQLLTSESESCFEEASAGLFGTYRPYAVFTPSMRGYHEYVVSTGTVSARCIAVRDTVEDVNGYYIDSVAVRR